MANGFASGSHYKPTQYRFPVKTQVFSNVSSASLSLFERGSTLTNHAYDSRAHHLETCVAKSRSADSSTEAPENAKQLLETFSETCNWEAIHSRPNRLEVSQPKSNDYQKFDIQSGKWLNEHPVQE